MRLSLLLLLSAALSSEARQRRAVVRKYDQPPSREIFYTWSKSLHTYDPQYDCLRDAMAHVENVTCVRFIEKDANKLNNDKQPYLLFESNEESVCVAEIGLKRAVPTTINLGKECGQHLTVCVHELLHALGMQHEHERSNRDEYVIIHKENIRSDKLGGYTQHLKAKDYEPVGPYDLSSIMHFGASDHAKEPGEHTMQARANPIMKDSLGVTLRGANRHPLSHRDELALNKIFQCAADCSIHNGCAHGGFADKTCKCRCPYGFSGPLCEELTNAKYNTAKECGRRLLREKSGYVTSPKFPKPYAPNSYCQYLLEAPRLTDVIEFRIEYMDLEAPTQSGAYDTCVDRLNIWPHGTDVKTNHLSCYADDVRRYKEYTYRTQYNWLLIEFRSNFNAQQHRGFNISYTVVDTRGLFPSARNGLLSTEAFARLVNARIHCYMCVDERDCAQPLHNHTVVQCQRAESCAVTRNSRGAVSWRGCTNMDSCPTLHEQCARTLYGHLQRSNLGNVATTPDGTQNVCTRCCADEFCNGASQAPTVSVLCMIVVAYLLS